jgi:hypothetical protein
MESSANTVAPTEVIAVLAVPDAPATPAPASDAPATPAPASDAPATSAPDAPASATPASDASATPATVAPLDKDLEALFKAITTDSGFLTRVTESIDKIKKDGKVDQYDVPEIVLVISEAVHSRQTFKLRKELVPVLIKMLYNFIVDTYKLVPEDKKAEIERLVDSSLRLLMLQPIVTEQLNRCFSFIPFCK